MALLLLALAIWDCTTLVLGDPLEVCATLAALEVPDPETVGVVVAGIAGVGLIAMWLPYVKLRRRERKYQPERVLVENIGRLREPYSDFVSLDADEVAMIAELRKAVEVVETAFATDSTATRSMTSEWMRLLLEANRLHNDGTLPTDEFKTLNTRLLEVVTASASVNAT